jgi:hypothetical protein
MVVFDDSRRYFVRGLNARPEKLHYELNKINRPWKETPDLLMGERLYPTAPEGSRLDYLIC